MLLSIRFLKHVENGFLLFIWSGIADWIFISSFIA